MGNPRLMWLLIAICIISGTTGIIALYWAGMSSTYGNPEGEISLSQYDKVNELNEDLQEIKERQTTIKEDEGAADRLGNLFANGYAIVSLIPKGLDVVIGFMTASIAEIPLGASGTIISINLIAIFLIIVLIGIVLAILLKFKT